MFKPVTNTDKPVKILIVAGSGTFNDSELLTEKLNQLIEWEKIVDAPDLEIVSGMATGADLLGYDLAKENNLVCHEMPADWKTYGKSAEYRRNVEMANFAEGLVVFWGWENPTKGTQHIIKCMRALNKPAYIIRY